MNDKSNEINKFLKRFHDSDNVDEVFTSGCCFWFAYILVGRFHLDDAYMVYSQKYNHFGAMIDGRVYDVTGDVTETYDDWISWEEFDDIDAAEALRIIRDCIYF